MADGPDRRAFDVVSAPIGTSGAEFQDVARRVASVDTLDAFLRDMRARYPDAAVVPAGAKEAAPPPCRPCRQSRKAGAESQRARQRPC